MRLPTARALVVSALLSVAWLPGNASAVSGIAGERLPVSLSRLNTHVRDAARRVDRVRASVATGRIEDALAGALALRDMRAAAVQTTSSPVPRGVPPVFRAPVGRLLSAWTRADDLVHRAIGSGTTLLGSPSRLLSTTARGTLALATAGGGERRTTRAHAIAARLERLRHRIEGAVDVPKIHAAALTMARAIDAALPALGASPALAGPGLPVTGCDMVDQTPYLCIGGSGDNTYEQDEGLLIDLGGNDTYLNHAGATDTFPLLIPPNPTPERVSVNIDVSGDDTYVSTVSADHQFTQGGGWVGVGMLVDGGGNDSYRVNASPQLGAWGQGQGDVGVGVLADLAGSDTYFLDGTHSPAASGQASAAIGGVGILLDGGAGDDSYRSVVAPDPFVGDDGLLRPGNGAINAVGIAALGAVALLADGGGADSMSLDFTASVPADETRPLYYPSHDCSVECSISTVNPGVLGVGWSTLGSAAVALTGDGPTTWSMTVSQEAPAIEGPPSALGFGYGSYGSFAAVSDGGGDDTYTLRGFAHAVRTVEIDDSCGCAGAEARAQGGEPDLGLTSVWTQGMGFGIAFPNQQPATGLLEDTSGNDRYTLEAEALAEAEVRDNRSVSPADGDSGAVAWAGTGPVLVRGQGLGYNGTGVGLLLDREGNDVYESKAISAAHAIASGVRPDAHLEGHAVAVRPDAHFANVSHMENVAQGAGLSQGLGGLKDEGGVDVYRATTSISAVAQPETEQVALDPASSVAIMQAAGARQGAGYLLDVEDSGGDTFQSTPLRTPTCYGTRGEDVWADCYQMQSNDVLLSLGWNR